MLGLSGRPVALRHRMHSSRTSVVALSVRASATPSSTVANSDAYARLTGLKVYRATDGQAVDLVQQWGQSDRAVVAWTRSLGCPFCQELAIQLRRDVKPRLDAMGVKLLMVSIGTPERGRDFAARTGFPSDSLFLDPDNTTYDALGLKRNVQDTFFNVATPLSLLKRAADGKTEDLSTVLNGWQPWMTPKGPYQALQQGGMFAFEGERVLYTYLDKATGDHADLGEVLATAQAMVDRGVDCGCDVATSS